VARARAWAGVGRGAHAPRHCKAPPPSSWVLPPSNPQGARIPHPPPWPPPAREAERARLAGELAAATAALGECRRALEAAEGRAAAASGDGQSREAVANGDAADPERVAELAARVEARGLPHRTHILFRRWR